MEFFLYFFEKFTLLRPKRFCGSLISKYHTDVILRLIKVSRLCDTSWFLNKEKYHYLIFLHKGRFIRAQWDSWSWFWHSGLGMSRPGIDHGLDWILKSIPVLILVLNKINDLAELRSSARLLVLVSKFKTWPVKTRYWSWSRHNFQIKTSLGLEQN